MSWGIPVHPYLTGVLFDVDEFNDNLLTFAMEYGSLNESNWTNNVLDAMQDADNVADDVGMTLHWYSAKRDPHAGVHPDIPQSLKWETLESTEMTIDTRGGKLDVTASFQLENEPTDANSAQTGLMFCIMLDGVPRFDSLLGGGDLGNDVMSRPAIRGSAGTAIPTTYDGTGPALRASQMGVSLQLLAENVSPGRHTIAIGARNTALDTLGINQKFSQVGILVKEMWA